MKPYSILSLFATAAIAASSLLPGCGSHGPGDGRIPQKSGVRSLHHRVYIRAVGEAVTQSLLRGDEGTRLDFGLKDCRWERLSYLGHRETTAFTQDEVPGSLPSELQTMFLEITALDSSGNPLHRSRIRNPYFTPSPHQGYHVTDCRLQFFVDLPAAVALDRVARIRIGYVDRPGQLLTLNGPFTRESIETDGEATSHPIPYGLLTPEGMLFDPTHDHGLLPERDFLAAPLIRSGDPATSFDLVILGDGFDRYEVSVWSEESLLASKFGRKARETAEYLLRQEPYRSLRDRINVWIVGTPSRQSGADDPRAGIERDTFYDSTFNMSCIDRLLGARNELRALEMASETPFDQMLMIVNSDKYGGQGGVIPTFSVNADANPVMAHELGHSLGLLADGYYYFRSTDDSDTSDNADSQTAIACQDRLLDESIDYAEPGYGANGLYDDEDRLAPNLTRYETLQLAKWSGQLGPQSPVVNMQFPIGKAVRSGSRVMFTYRPERGQDELVLVAGPTGAQAAWIERARSIAINGRWLDSHEIRIDHFRDSSGISGRMVVFYSMGGIPVVSGREIRVTLAYPDEATAQRVEGFSANAHTLPIASRIFDPMEPGLFRGAFPSLGEVWRSSYASRMMVTTHEHDVVEQEALRRAILRFSGATAP